MSKCKANPIFLSMVIFLSACSCFSEHGRFSLADALGGDSYRKTVIDYAESYIQRLLYKRKLECFYNDSSAQGCDNFYKFNYDKPTIEIKNKKNGHYLLAAFSEEQKLTPYSIFEVNDSGYLYAVDGGIFMADVTAVKKMFLEDY